MEKAAREGEDGVSYWETPSGDTLEFRPPNRWYLNGAGVGMIDAEARILRKLLDDEGME